MGHFIITLPNNQQGDVRWGTVRKKEFFLNPFRTSKLKSEEKKGYIIKIDSATKDQKEYRLLKTTEGKWTSDDDGGFQVAADDEISLAIKNAIDNYENQRKRKRD